MKDNLKNANELLSSSYSLSSRPTLDEQIAFRHLESPADNMDSAPPNPTPQRMTADQLPPEALALAGRLFDAARNGQMDIFEAALPRGRLANLTNDKGDSLVMLAAYHGHAPLVRLLLQHGADPNRLNDRGQSPLAGVVFKNEKECVLALLESGADPLLGEPSALAACQVFKQEEFEGLFRTQIDRLMAGGQAVGNGTTNGNATTDGEVNGHGNDA